MLSLLSTVVLAAPQDGLPAAGFCDTPLALEVLRGRAQASHPGMLLPPGGAGDVSPPPMADRAFNGSPYALHQETEHFTINWFDEALPQPAVNLAAEALEQAWTAFIDEQGWPEPVSSDRYYLWVLLDPSLGETTGYTVEFFDDQYADGYPVIYLNPDWISHPDFYRALAAHEFMHAIQFAMRDWSEQDSEQSWYWEASANHASELAGPDWDGHQYTSAWYAEQAQLRFDSEVGAHHYGMFVLNAYLEDQLGPGTMKGIWEQAAADPNTQSWDLLITQATDLPADEVIASFSAAYANGLLPESALYTPMTGEGDYAAGLGGTLDTLGSHAWTAPEAGWIQVEGPALLGAVDGQTGTTIWAEAGSAFTVTGLEDGAVYTLSEGTAPDTGEPGDPEKGCGGCAAGGGPGWLLGALGLMFVRRRKIRVDRRA
ncbi:MAG: DUF6055 domain-containing protein [Myxococcota bacterium]|nr:DUF6055 domain-containing protein [Myxococcota bacterium]